MGPLEMYAAAATPVRIGIGRMRPAANRPAAGGEVVFVVEDDASVRNPLSGLLGSSGLSVQSFVYERRGGKGRDRHYVLVE